jgi:hypothetical protein
METDTDPCLAGLIPSDSLQQKRADLIKAVSDETESMSSSSSALFDRKKKKKKKICLTCVTKKERKILHPIYNNASFIREIGDTETPTIRTSTNHFSLTDTRQFGEEQPPPPPPPQTTVTFADENEHIPIDAFRFYEPVFRLDLSTQHMTRPIVLLGKKNRFIEPTTEFRMSRFLKVLFRKFGILCLFETLICNNMII